MSARRLSAAGLAALHRAVNDPATVERFRSRVVQVPGVIARDGRAVSGRVQDWCADYRCATGTAEWAATAAGDAGDEHSTSFADAGHGGADLQHRADGLVSEGSGRTPPPVYCLEDVKISPADGHGVDSDGVTAVMDLGQRGVGHGLSSLSLSVAA